MTLFEISIKKHVTKKLLCTLACDFFNIPFTQISSILIFSSDKSNFYQLGLDVVYQISGYATLAEMGIRKELDFEKLKSLAFYLSKELISEIAIGNQEIDIEFATGEFLVTFPDGKTSKAFESYNKNCWDVKIY